jgi:hypothetical protein
MLHIDYTHTKGYFEIRIHGTATIKGYHELAERFNWLPNQEGQQQTSNIRWTQKVADTLFNGDLNMYFNPDEPINFDILDIVGELPTRTYGNNRTVQLMPWLTVKIDHKFYYCPDRLVDYRYPVASCGRVGLNTLYKQLLNGQVSLPEGHYFKVHPTTHIAPPKHVNSVGLTDRQRYNLTCPECQTSHRQNWQWHAVFSDLDNRMVGGSQYGSRQLDFDPSGTITHEFSVYDLQRLPQTVYSNGYDTGKNELKAFLVDEYDPFDYVDNWRNSDELQKRTQWRKPYEPITIFHNINHMDQGLDCKRCFFIENLINKVA